MKFKFMGIWVVGFLTESNRRPRDWQSLALTNWATLAREVLRMSMGRLPLSKSKGFFDFQFFPFTRSISLQGMHGLGAGGKKRRWSLMRRFDWCCFYYFVWNSLVTLLEALCARIFSLDSWISVFSELDTAAQLQTGQHIGPAKSSLSDA